MKRKRKKVTEQKIDDKNKVRKRTEMKGHHERLDRRELLSQLATCPIRLRLARLLTVTEKWQRFPLIFAINIQKYNCRQRHDAIMSQYAQKKVCPTVR
jgi:hypothetical protein